MEEAAARRGDVSGGRAEGGDGGPSHAEPEGPDGMVSQFEKINRIGEGTYGVVCACPRRHEPGSRLRV
jgi:hypothetical protein